MISAYGGHFKELRKEGNLEKVVEVLLDEEKDFVRTFDSGLKAFQKFVKKAKAAGATEIAGKDAFFLWDTKGFPVDLTTRMAEDAGLSCDTDGFKTCYQNPT